MRIVITCLASVLAAGLAGLACRVVPAPLSGPDKSAMRAATDSFTLYVVQGRDSAAAAIYAENAKLMPPNHGIVEGRAAIRAFLDRLPPISRFTAAPVEIDGLGDLAYLRGTYQLTFTAADGRPATQEHGKFLEIRRRQDDGRWLITVDIFNSDVAK
jgi:ketosteroid isomerase-like protein